MKITDKSVKPEAPLLPGRATPLPPDPPLRDPGWQYRSVQKPAGAALDEYGVDGWELVSVVPNLIDPAMVICYFKRRPR